MFPSWLAADVGSSSEAVSCSAYNVTFLEWRSQGSWIFIVSIPQSKSLKDIRWKFHGLFWPTLRCPTVSFYCMTLTRSESKAAPDSSLRGGILHLLMGRDNHMWSHEHEWWGYCGHLWKIQSLNLLKYFWTQQRWRTIYVPQRSLWLLLRPSLESEQDWMW